MKYNIDKIKESIVGIIKEMSIEPEEQCEKIGDEIIKFLKFANILTPKDKELEDER